MIDIEKYMEDGANWQTQAVLAYLRSLKNHTIDETWNLEYHRYNAEFNVGRYENCREQGYIFSVQYKCEQRNYCVYEHRNSDNLCVVVFDGLTINTPTPDMVFNAMGDSKWNYTKAFPCGQIMECGNYIIDDVKKWINSLVENNKD